MCLARNEKTLQKRYRMVKNLKKIVYIDCTDSWFVLSIKEIT